MIPLAGKSKDNEEWLPQSGVDVPRVPAQVQIPSEITPFTFAIIGVVLYWSQFAAAVFGLRIEAPWGVIDLVAVVFGLTAISLSVNNFRSRWSRATIIVCVISTVEALKMILKGIANC